jgi:hypothetical protein
MDSTLTIVLTVLASLAGGKLVNGILADMRQRRAEPRADAHDTIDLQQSVIATFHEANALHREDARTITAQARTITAQAETLDAQARTIAALTNTNTKLLSKLDGLPTMVAEQAAQILVKQSFIEVLIQALIQAGVSVKEQPVQPEEKPLTQLEPPTLLKDLAAEQSATPDKPIEDKPK